ncbi:Hypothetical protein FSTVST1_46 [Faustovirus ST1]|nr:Hypothetical protein FSTVST1_46 [Faustovirus ST1]
MENIIFNLNTKPVHRKQNEQTLQIPDEIYDVVYEFTEDKYITSSVDKRRRKMYREQTLIEIDTKYIKNFARVCLGCGDIELFADDLTWDEKMALGGYAYDHQMSQGYDSEEITIGGYKLEDIDIDDPPICVNYMKELCSEYVAKSGIRDDPFIKQFDPDEVNKSCRCESWIYLYGFDDKHADELTARLYKCERWLADNIVKKMSVGKTRASFILMFNKIVVNVKSGMLIKKEKIEETRDRLRGYGIGFTWHEM